MEERRKDRGFSLLEALVVLALIGIMTGFAVVALGTFLQQYRLNSASRELMGALALTRLKAVSANAPYNLTLNTDADLNTRDFYQIWGSEDSNGNGTADPWEDVDRDGNIDSDYTFRIDQNGDTVIDENDGKPIDYGFVKRAITGVANAPDGGPLTDSPDTGDTATVVFNPNGTLKTTTTHDCIVLQNQMQMAQCVCVDEDGLLRLYRLEGVSWKEIK